MFKFYAGFLVLNTVAFVLGFWLGGLRAVERGRRLQAEDDLKALRELDRS